MKKRVDLALGETRITITGDCDADTSTIGEYSDNAKPGSIIRESGEYIEDLPDDEEVPRRGREYRFFHPYGAGEKIGSDDYRKYGKQDFKRMESLNNGQWCFIGVTVQTDVVAKSNDLRLYPITASLWGIESDADGKYMKSVIDDLKFEVKEQLLVLGFTTRQINKTLNNAREVE